MRAIIKDPQHFKRVAEAVQIFNLRQDNTDVKFVVARGHRLFAHKLLLCAVSSTLKKMFLECPDQIDLITVHLPDIEGRILRLLLDFLYEGSLRCMKEDYEELKALMDQLGIVLHRSSNGGAAQPPTETQASAQEQPQMPPQAVYYIQAPSGTNSQGQMQYMLAPGQVLQVAPAGAMPQAQMMQAGQVVQMAAPATSMAQEQVVQIAPQVMTQANGQMVQGATQVVNTNVQQNNMMHVAPQTNAAVVPIVAGNQVVQCSSQMVVPCSQPSMINGSQMQGNIHNQVAQPTPRPQYVMSSTANQMTTSRAQTHYSQPHMTPQQRTAIRARTTQPVQSARTSTANAAPRPSITTQDILDVLKEKCDNLEKIETLTARELRQLLEPRLGISLSAHELLIENVLTQFRKGNEGSASARDESGSSSSATATTAASNSKKSRRKPGPASSKKRYKRMDLSDDEDDKDFDPKKAI